jgi:periplasmic protein CpxP/Spy
MGLSIHRKETSMQNSLRKISTGGLLIAALAVGAAYAQDNTTQSAPAPTATTHPAPAPNPNRQVKHLTKALNLTSAQQSQIKPIIADQDQQFQSLRSDSTIAPKDKRAKFMSIRQDTDMKLEAVLNDQQKQQFEQLRAQQRERAQERHQQRQSGGNEAAPPADSNNGTQPQS